MELVALIQLAIAAKLLPLSNHVFTVELHLLALRDAVLRLGMVRANLLTLRHAVFRLAMVGPHLLTLGHAVLRLRVVGAHLLTLSAARLHVAVAVRLLAFGAHLDVLSPLRPLRRNPLLMLHPRRGKSAAATVTTAGCLHTLATAVAAAIRCLSVLVATATPATLSLCRAVLTTTVAPGPRTGRGCDR
jgi:hypothetical protein